MSWSILSLLNCDSWEVGFLTLPVSAGLHFSWQKCWLGVWRPCKRPKPGSPKFSIQLLGRTSVGRRVTLSMRQSIFFVVSLVVCCHLSVFCSVFSDVEMFLRFFKCFVQPFLLRGCNIFCGCVVLKGWNLTSVVEPFCGLGTVGFTSKNNSKTRRHELFLGKTKGLENVHNWVWNVYVDKDRNNFIWYMIIIY